MRRSGPRRGPAPDADDDLPRRDLSLGHTAIAGLAGPRVASVTALVDGRRRPLALSARRRAFLLVLRGVVPAGAAPLEVRYRDGAVRRFAGARLSAPS